LPLAHDMRIETYARIVHEHAAVDFSNVHFDGLAGEDVADSGFEAQWDAKIFGKMIQRAYRENTERNVGAYQRAGHGVHGSVATTCHHRLAVLAHSACGQRRELLATPRNDATRLHAEFLGYTSDVRTGRFHMNGSTVEDPGRAYS